MVRNECTLYDVTMLASRQHSIRKSLTVSVERHGHPHSSHSGWQSGCLWHGWVRNEWEQARLWAHWLSRAWIFPSRISSTGKRRTVTSMSWLSKVCLSLRSRITGQVGSPGIARAVACRPAVPLIFRSGDSPQWMRSVPSGSMDIMTLRANMAHSSPFLRHKWLSKDKAVRHCSALTALSNAFSSCRRAAI